MLLALTLQVSVGACADAPSDTGLVRQFSLDDEITSYSDAFAPRMQDDLGIAVEARFVRDARYVLILDKHAPYLRLFTSAGQWLWSGGLDGGGPMEFHFPLTMGVDNDQVLVFQRGRISRWRLDADSLGFIESIPLAPHYLPVGAVRDCADGWFLYARNDHQFRIPADSVLIVKEVEFLHYLELSGGMATVRPIWSGPRGFSAFSVDGHAGVRIARRDTVLAVLHRATTSEPGSVLHFNCAGQLLQTFPEWSLITGDTVPVQIPRQRALQWTSGIAVYPNGYATAIHRWFSPQVHRVQEYHFKTEIFRFEGRAYVGSVLIPGQWQLMDYHPAVGALLTTDAPVPHFMVVPGDVLLPPSGEQL